MTHSILQTKLAELRGLPQEAEWVEFKSNWDKKEDIGEYISALSNSAALLGKPYGYMVWGVSDGIHDIIGTTFLPRQTKGKGNEDLEMWLCVHLKPRIDFRIHEFETEGKSIVLFEIPAARGIPVDFQGERFIRVGSYKKKLREYPEKEITLFQMLAADTVDWSSEIIESATLESLDAKAITFARAQYAEKHPKLADELIHWDDGKFLDKARVCIGGKITRTAMILLGNEDYSHLLAPSQSRLTWVLKDADGIEQDYEHFDIPLIFAGERLLAKIRNLTVRHLPSGTLFPHEVSQYDPWVIRETLHNCIAHQDYPAGGRITVVEKPDSLLFTNLGSFIPGTVEEMIERETPPEIYRNPFLAQAMVNLNMIDTIGSGIRRMFTTQKKRSFPMPDFTLDDPTKVTVRLTGQVIDENYTKLLLNQSDLNLLDVIALDRVQKKLSLAEETFNHLKRLKLIEGRRPNLYVSATVAALTGGKAAYIKNRGLDKEHYKELVKLHLEKFGAATRADLEDFLREKISDALTEEQKTNRVRNLLQEMRRGGVITPNRRGQGALWELAKPDEEPSNLADSESEQDSEV
jgi:ATP-dependent DNA helicase RecG